jgi:Ca2+-binding RTX toxin-like protein
MTSSTTRPKRRFQFIATVVVLVLAALVVPAGSSANKHDVHGVRAEIKHGTLEVKGNGRANTLALRLKAGDPTQVEIDVGDGGSADFSFARSQLRTIEVRMGNRDDSVRIDDSNGAFTDSIPTTIAGGGGDDSLSGGLGAETYGGGNGDDSVFGGKGADTAHLGRGNDSFRWDNGDGSDVIEGQDGSDTMVFNGAAGNEDVTLTANGERLRFFRTQGNVTMDTDDVEIVDFNALGGADNVTINELKGTDVRHANLDLAGTLGGSASDGAVDNVFVNGTNGDDRVRINGTASGADVTGLATTVSVRHPDPTDRLSVNTLAGTDRVLVNGVAGVLQVLVDGNPA